MPSEVEVNVDGRRLRIRNLDKVLYPQALFTKAHVLDYYMRVARYLLPHFRQRPVTLKRYPEGVFGEAFYEKNAPGFTPAWVKTFPVQRGEHEGVINYILINDRATLVWVASMGSLELHPFLHHAPRIEQPTAVIFDLDPGEGRSILDCARLAFQVRDLLDKLGLKSFPKVTGSKGIHIVVPLNTPVSYAATKPFAQAIAEQLARAHPRGVVAQMVKSVRKGKIFIDWSQNDVHKTNIGTYSLRAKERPFVSMPVTWTELKHAIAKRDPRKLFWDAEAALLRLETTGDIFAPVTKLKQKLPKEFLALIPETPPRAPRTPAALRRYAAKRRFDVTSEPVPGGSSAASASRQGSRRRFVIQKHAARQLHYDFRLEMHGVLKSWAVPKGLPLKRGERRGAFPTEDHPLEYLEFEGRIPKGQYGGGTVMVWDIGTYATVDGNYFQGHLRVFLTGKKLKGEWTLQKIADENGKNNGKRHWLIIKTGASARPIPARREARSALTGRTMDEIASDRHSKIWQSNRV